MVIRIEKFSFHILFYAFKYNFYKNIYLRYTYLKYKSGNCNKTCFTYYHFTCLESRTSGIIGTSFASAAVCWRDVNAVKSGQIVSVDNMRVVGSFIRWPVAGRLLCYRPEGFKSALLCKSSLCRYKTSCLYQVSLTSIN